METTSIGEVGLPRLVTPVAEMAAEVERFFRQPAGDVLRGLVEAGFDQREIADKLDLTGNETRRLLAHYGLEAPRAKARGKRLHHNGLSMTAHEWADYLGLNYVTVRQRVTRKYETKWVLYAGEYPKGMSVTYLRLLDLLLYGVQSADAEWLAQGLKQIHGEKLTPEQVRERMKNIARKGLVQDAPGGTWALTGAGRRMAMGVAP